MHKININEGWQFKKIPDGNNSDLEGLITVTLPHTWYSDEDPYRGLTVYKKPQDKRG